MKTFRSITLFTFALLMPWSAMSQETLDTIPLPDQAQQLKLGLLYADNDTTRLRMLAGLTLYYMELNPDSAIHYSQQTVEVSRAFKMPSFVSVFTTVMGYAKYRNGAYLEAFQDFKTARSITEDPGFLDKITPLEIKGMELSTKKEVMAATTAAYKRCIAHLYLSLDNFELARKNYFGALADYEVANNTELIAEIKMNLGEYYLRNDSLDLSMKYYTESLEDFEQIEGNRYLGLVLHGLASIYAKRGEPELAKTNYIKALDYSISVGSETVGSYSKIRFARFSLKEGADSVAFRLATEAMNFAQKNGDASTNASAHIILSSYYRKLNNFEEADRYSQIGNAIRDSLQNAKEKNINIFHNAILKENIANSENELERISEENRYRSYAFIGGLLVLTIIGFLLYRNNRQKQKSNKVLGKTLSDLKSTQSQLIQAEKMASLGELTAGIAHEIQNPLNFVNNFSEVSNELIDETVEEVEAVKKRHALSQQQDSSQDKESLTEITDLLSDVKSNIEKITHHGKRADAIVKGMLAHSSSGKGEKTPTNLNALAEEYLKLSYHGLRAKDKNFNADYKTHFDQNLPKANVVPQDIGRVLLNLINNAFQACAQAGTDKPLVSVKTERATSDALRITITDNGPGIPPEIKDKIFQPFFTTKPTGEGTGLGLSLSYDIVKAHSGELEVESELGKGSSFFITLPT